MENINQPFDITTIQKKLNNADFRSIKQILNNTELCKRIIAENPISLLEYSKKSGISVYNIRKLIDNNVISSFSNSESKGSRVWIFENEIKDYFDNGIALYNPIDGSVKNFITNFLKIAELAHSYSFINDRELSILKDSFEFSVKDLALKYDLTTQRIRAINLKCNEKLEKFGNSFEEALEELQTKNALIDKLNMDIKLLIEANENFETKPLFQRTLLQSNLDTHNLSNRLVNALYREGIVYVGDLTTLTLTKVKKINNIGNRSLIELLDFMEANNINFKTKSRKNTL